MPSRPSCRAALPTSSIGERSSAARARPERLDRVVEPGLGGPDRDFEGIGQLARSQAEVERENEDRSLSRRQATKSPLQLVAIGELVCAIELGRFAWQDGDLGPPPSTVAPDISAGTDYEPVEPGVEPLGVAQRRQIAPSSHQRILCRILRKIGVAQDEASDGVESIDGVADKDGEGLAVSASRPVDEVRLQHPAPSLGRPTWSLYTLWRSATPAWFDSSPEATPPARPVDSRARAGGCSRIEVSLGRTSATGRFLSFHPARSTQSYRLTSSACPSGVQDTGFQKAATRGPRTDFASGCEVDDVDLHGAGNPLGSPLAAD